MTDESTGAAFDALPRATEITTENGVVLWVYPLTFHDSQRWIADIRSKTPPPNAKDYETPLPPDVASFEGQMSDGANSDDYKAALRLWQIQLDSDYTDRVLAGCTDTPEGVDVLVARYARIVAAKRRGGELPENEWLATLRAAVLVTDSDIRQVLDAAQLKKPLDFHEVIDGVALFRLSDQQDSGSGLPERQAQARIRKQAARQPDHSQPVSA